MSKCPHCGEDFDRLDRHEPHCKMRPVMADPAAADEVMLKPVLYVTEEPIFNRDGRPLGTKTAVKEKPCPPGLSLHPVKLHKNYRPAGEYRIVEEVLHPFHGVGQAGKVWAGSVVELPGEEARRLVDMEITETFADKDPNGRPIRRRITRKKPLAERADPRPY